MPTPSPSPAVRRGRAPGSAHRAALVGLVVSLALMAVAVALPAVTGWNVRVRWWPPLHAVWDPRLGPGSPLAVLVALLAARWAVDLAERVRWRTLLAGSFVVGLAWMLALATVDGVEGIAGVLDHPYEYLRTARRTEDVPGMLAEYVSRITFDAAPRKWPVHVAGHPPGAVLVFIGLVRIGLGSGLEAGLVVTAVAATTPVAVLVTAERLGAGDLARRAAPFLVLGPAAVWQCVSADGMFAAVGAWGIAALACAVRAGSPGARLGWGVGGGLLLGWVVMMSYGLPLLGIPALTVLALRRRWSVLPVAVLAACLVVAGFAAFGFYYWEALPALQERYWGGVASRRPAAYWMWGNLAALLFAAGPLVGAALAHLTTLRPERATPERALMALTLAGWAMVAAADLSQMSRAEVERIWLPFVPWLLLGCALLPPRWRRAGLVLQLASALAVQHLLDTGW